MTRFYLVRHGQTEWNRIERFRGRVDIPLNATGVAQAQAAAESLVGKGISAIFSSPLGRALKTAEIIGARLGLPVEKLDGLVDMDYGEWQGLTPDEVAQEYSSPLDLWLKHPEQARIPSGESLDDVGNRVLAAVYDLASPHPERPLLLSSHKVVCKVLLCAVLGLDNSHFWQIEQDNTAISVFDYNPKMGFSVSLVNDTCHLRSLPSA